MANINKNGILDAQEAQYYRERSSNAKFKQQVAYGLGAASVFGLMTGVASKLFVAALPAAGGVAIGPLLGLVALGVIGVGLLYLSAQYLSENTLLDQAMQAKQIDAASRGKAPAVEQVVEPKVSNFPSTALALAVDAAPTQTANDNDTVPKTSVTAERTLADTMLARGAANENTPADKANASWEEKTAASDEPTAAKVRG